MNIEYRILNSEVVVCVGWNIYIKPAHPEDFPHALPDSSAPGNSRLGASDLYSVPDQHHAGAAPMDHDRQGIGEHSIHTLSDPPFDLQT